MKKMKFVSGMCVAGMLVIGGMAGCGTNETKSTANQQESQKERDMKEADKAAMEYVRAFIEVDTVKLNELLYNKYKFYEEHVVDPGTSKEMGERYDLYRYDLKEGKKEYFYKIQYYHPVKETKSTMELRIVKEEKDGKWKNYEWSWDTHYNVSDFAGSIKPIHVHKWGQKE
ncbi:hypothetical protein FC697_20165 [Bacillus wiedmannii]|uniref:hypothetical protein n=1 Tax=Bacillus wiedmannii TaxID=1890302 RepID=UPI0010BCFA69|nr:hypothetical protein [Bacillus wiedmannii]TKH19529.1 hypothetical protein FC697_20165 [Bacillus wiedmannii]